MTPTTKPNPAERDISRLLDPPTAAALLHDLLSAEAALNGTIEQVRVERCWPGRRGEFLFEWSFAMGRKRRCALFGVVPGPAPAAGEQEVHAASLTADGLRGVRRYLPDWKLLVHSPDCDPGMPHLVECLDPSKMAGHLGSLWSQEPSLRPPPGPAVRCKTAGYRAGRRAAIAYRPLAAGFRSQGLLGKTFHDGRAERLIETHRELNEQLTWYSQGRLRVPVPTGHLPDLHMALFAWVRPRRIAGSAETPAGLAHAAIDVLTALHRTPLGGVPAFSVQDECGIVSHWQAALRCVDPTAAAATNPLVDRLLETAGRIGSTAQCTIHRDFYERQFIAGKPTAILLDLDTLARGAPSVDLGNLFAHLFLASLQHEASPAEFDHLTRELLARYEHQMGPVDRRALAFFRATALFRIGAVHALRTATGRHATAMWVLAERVLKPAVARSSASLRAGSAGAGERAAQRSATRGSA